MSHPVGENLELVVDKNGRQRLRCMQCDANLGTSSTSWRTSARRRVVPATSAGPLMEILKDQYCLAQLVCPSCGALFDTQLVEVGTDREC